MSQVLVLNASYEPLNITTWRRATVLMLKDKAVSIEEDKKHNLRDGFHLPTVIRLKRFIRIPYRQIPLNRKNILQRDSNRCQYCGLQKKSLSIDHVIPRSRGGQDCWENVITACLACNIQKGNKTPEEAQMPLLRRPLKPLNNLNFEANIQISSGRYKEWKKYLIGWDN